MIRSTPWICAAALVASSFLPLSLYDHAAQAQSAKPAARTDPFGGFGGNSKDPIRIDARR
jgi:hypothetical protein